MPRKGRPHRRTRHKEISNVVPYIGGEPSVSRHSRRRLAADASWPEAQVAFRDADALALRADDGSQWQITMREGGIVQWWPASGLVKVNGYRSPQLPHIVDWHQLHRFIVELKTGMYWRPQDAAQPRR